MIWAIKDSSIGNTFFDEGAAKFLLPHLDSPSQCSKPHPLAEGSREKEEVLVKTKPLKRMKFMLDPVGVVATPMFTWLIVNECLFFQR